MRTRWGVAQPTAAFTGFGTDWIDYDNDGWLDLFVANGAVNIIESQRGQPVPFRMKNLLFRNTRRPRRLRRRRSVAQAGPAFAADQTGRGAAFGDIDNDGDIDVVVTNNGGPVRLLLNQAASDAHWLQLRLEQPGNRQGMGALVGVERAGRPTLWRRVKTDGSYASASDSRVQVGLGTTAALDAVVVHWPDGRRERWTGLQADRLVTVRRGTGTLLPAAGDQK